MDLELMKQLFNIDSPTGYTKNVIAFLEDYLNKIGYQTTKNKKGNLIVDIPGKSNYTIGLSAHIDTLGLMVRSIRNDGNLNFTNIGGIITPTLDGEYCKIYTRTNKVYTGTILSNYPSAHVYPNAKTAPRDNDNMYIRLDEYVTSTNDTKKLEIENGDYIAVDPKFTVTPSGYIKTRFLDDKASVFILLELLKKLKEKKQILPNTLKIIFTTYEEVGHGCANLPYVDELLAIDMGCIGLDLKCNEKQVSICAKDSSGPYDYDMVTTLINLAKENNIDYAVDVYPMYSSDASAALRGGNDIKAALIGSGIHASHGMERTHIDGLKNTLNLVYAYITK